MVVKVKLTNFNIEETFPDVKYIIDHNKELDELVFENGDRYLLPKDQYDILED